MHHGKIKGTRTELCIWCNTPVHENQVSWEGLIVGVLMAEPGLARQLKLWAITKALRWRLLDEYLVCEASLRPSHSLLCLSLDAVCWWSTRTGWGGLMWTKCWTHWRAMRLVGCHHVDQAPNLLQCQVPTCRPSAEPSQYQAPESTPRWMLDWVPMVPRWRTLCPRSIYKFVLQVCFSSLFYKFICTCLWRCFKMCCGTLLRNCSIAGNSWKLLHTAEWKQYLRGICALKLWRVCQIPFLQLQDLWYLLGWEVGHTSGPMLWDW